MALVEVIRILKRITQMVGPGDRYKPFGIEYLAALDNLSEEKTHKFLEKESKEEYIIYLKNVIDKVEFTLQSFRSRLLLFRCPMSDLDFELDEISWSTLEDPTCNDLIKIYNAAHWCTEEVLGGFALELANLRRFKSEFNWHIDEENNIIDIDDNEGFNRIGYHLGWIGDKYELCELIRALSKSEKIERDGHKISEDELRGIFASLFDQENLKKDNYKNALKQGLNAYKRKNDGKFFLAELLNLISNDNLIN